MKKKEKSTTLVLFTIFALFLIIILPPIFRKTMPKKAKQMKTKKLSNYLTVKLIIIKMDII